MLAAGVTAYDNSSADITDPSIGQLKFIIKSFSPTGDIDLFTELETKTCPLEYFLIDNFDVKTPFFEFPSYSENDVKIYGPKMRCLTKPEQLSLWGNFDTSYASNLMIVFEKCSNSTSSVPCKTEKEI